MKKFSLRLDINIEAQTEMEAKKKAELLIKELPKLESSRLLKSSLYDYQRKSIVK